MILVFLICTVVRADCPNFNKTGYKSLYFQEDTPGVFLCAVTCDKEKGFYPTELNGEHSDNLNFYSVYIRTPNETDWFPAFKNTSGDLNCQFGCLGKVDIDEPYFIVSSEATPISSDPLRFYKSTVDCKEGYFPSINLENTDIKFIMVCVRGPDDLEDIWMWEESFTAKLECRLGCPRFGTNSPAHQDSFGAEARCFHVGKLSYYSSDLVNTCNLNCDTKNGYFAIMDSNEFIECTNIEYEERVNFLCEQGCLHPEKSEEIMDLFNARNMEVKCSSPLMEHGWYSLCTVSCKGDTTPSVLGIFGYTDLIYCRLGKWDFKTLILEC